MWLIDREEHQKSYDGNTPRVCANLHVEKFKLLSRSDKENSLCHRAKVETSFSPKCIMGFVHAYKLIRGFESGFKPKLEGNVLINLRRQCFTCSLARIFNNVSFFEDSKEITWSSILLHFVDFIELIKLRLLGNLRCTYIH